MLATLTQAATAAGTPDSIDRYLDAYVASHDFSGTVLVASGNEVRYFRAVGLADRSSHASIDRHSRFLVGSLAKTFTAAAVELLERDGKLGYDELLNKYVPEYRYAGEITVRQLLNHAAGVPDIYALPDFARVRTERYSLTDIAKWLGGYALDFAPGTTTRYSNSGYSLLALVIERASGRPYGEFLQEKVFGPLGLANTGAHVRDRVPRLVTGYDAAPAPTNLQPAHSVDPSWLAGNGYVYSTADDLSRWLDIANAGRKVNFSTLPYAYGWGIRKEGGRDVLEQDGRISGYSARISIDRLSGLKVVVLSNIQDDAVSRINMDLRRAFQGDTIEAPAPRRSITLDPESAREYVGRYALGKSLLLDISLRDGNLFIENVVDRIQLVLDPIDRDQFFFRTLYVPVGFTRGADGHVTALNWNGQLSLPRSADSPDPSHTSPMEKHN